MTQKALLGDKLVHDGYITEDQLRVALKEQKLTGKKLGEVLITLGFLSEAVSREVVGDAVGFSSMSIKGVVPDVNALQLISESFARSHQVMPISLTADHLKVAMSSPDDILLLDKIKRHIKQSIRIEPILVVENEIQYAIDLFYGYELSIDGILRELETGETEGVLSGEQNEYSQPMVRLVDNILTDAVKRGHRIFILNLKNTIFAFVIVLMGFCNKFDCCTNLFGLR